MRALRGSIRQRFRWNAGNRAGQLSQVPALAGESEKEVLTVREVERSTSRSASTSAGTEIEMMKITYGPVEDRFGYTRNVFANGQIVGEVQRTKYRHNGGYDYKFVPWSNDFLPARATWFKDLAERIVARAQERAASFAAQKALIDQLNGKS